MAETAVTLVLDRLEKFLSAQATIFRGVHRDVERIKSALELMNSFLKDADEQAEGSSTTSHFVKSWVKQLREDVAFRMEDVVDLYFLKVVEHNRHHRHGVLIDSMTKGVEKLKSVAHRREISHEIEEIGKKIDDLHRMTKATPDLKKAAISSSNNNQDPRRCSGRRLEAHYVEESHLVGVKHHQEVITDWLFSGESKRSVMVVVGPGGIGKTTIVKNVYNKHKKMQTFECFAWITVSRPQDNNNMLREIIRTIPSTSRAIETSDGFPLIDKVRECLTGKRYLIVFDDVWESNFWEDVKLAMQDSNESSRVIIITREERVVEYCKCNTYVDVHKLKPLSPNDALELFCRKAFREEGCPQELKALSMGFVTKCNGVPLAIVSIASLLSTKEKTVTEWKNVFDRLDSLLQSHPFLENVQQVMSESYRDLPPHLKLCLLYFGLFPEGYSISCMRLIRLWVAEGFVKETETENATMEGYAMGYLTELFRKNLVRVSGVDFDGSPKSCQVDDLMHKFIIKKCEEQNFSQVIKMKDQITQPVPVLDSVGRRLTILAKSNESVAVRSHEEWKRVRSCFVFDDAKMCPLTNPFFSSFELLARLDLSDARLDLLPEEVGELLNLRYLSLRNTNIRSLPRSIGKLENLQTLDLKLTQVHELPEEIKNLIKLRHLLAYYIRQASGLDSLQGVKLKAGLHHLTSLLKLSFLDATNSSSLIKQLAKLKKLRKLGIIKLKKEDGKALCKAIEGMTHLCSLSIGAMKSNEILMLQSLSNPPQNLQRLYLYGRLERFPNWIPKLNNLSRLYLRWSGLSEDPLPYLNDLPKLLHLELYDTYRGQELHFKNARLGALKVLHIESMPELKTIKIDQGALPYLEKIKIGKCPKMVQVPRDLRNLKIPKALYLYDMPDQFVKRITGPRGEDYLWIVKKIPVALYARDDHFVNLHNFDH